MLMGKGDIEMMTDLGVVTEIAGDIHPERHIGLLHLRLPGNEIFPIKAVPTSRISSVATNRASRLAINRASNAVTSRTILRILRTRTPATVVSDVRAKEPRHVIRIQTTKLRATAPVDRVQGPGPRVRPPRMAAAGHSIHAPHSAISFVIG